MGRFELVRDDEDRAVAIAADGRWIVHLVSGTDRNEANAAKIVAILNAAAVVVASRAVDGVSDGDVALAVAICDILPRRSGENYA